jgi:hypothetical protein
MIYSGFEKVEGACLGAPHLTKPASHAALLARMADLILAARARVL